MRITADAGLVNIDLEGPPPTGAVTVARPRGGTTAPAVVHDGDEGGAGTIMLFAPVPASTRPCIRTAATVITIAASIPGEVTPSPIKVTPHFIIVTATGAAELRNQPVVDAIRCLCGITVAATVL